MVKKSKKKTKWLPLPLIEESTTSDEFKKKNQRQACAKQFFLESRANNKISSKKLYKPSEYEGRDSRGYKVQNSKIYRNRVEGQQTERSNTAFFNEGEKNPSLFIQFGIFGKVFESSK